MDQEPSVGRIVHYQASANDEYPPRTLAALITKVNDDGTVALGRSASAFGTILPKATVRANGIGRLALTRFHWLTFVDGIAEAEPAEGLFGGGGDAKFSTLARQRCLYRPGTVNGVLAYANTPPPTMKLSGAWVSFMLGLPCCSDKRKALLHALTMVNER